MVYAILSVAPTWTVWLNALKGYVYKGRIYKSYRKFFKGIIVELIKVRRVAFFVASLLELQWFGVQKRWIGKVNYFRKYIVSKSLNVGFFMKKLREKYFLKESWSRQLKVQLVYTKRIVFCEILYKSTKKRSREKGKRTWISVIAMRWTIINDFESLVLCNNFSETLM